MLTVAGAAGGRDRGRGWCCAAGCPGAGACSTCFWNRPRARRPAPSAAAKCWSHLENLLGAEGVTTTQLTPGGKARFGNALVDVMAVGELIPRDSPVIVTEVRGNHVVVKLAGGE